MQSSSVLEPLVQISSAVYSLAITSIGIAGFGWGIRYGVLSLLPVIALTFIGSIFLKAIPIVTDAAMPLFYVAVITLLLGWTVRFIWKRWTSPF